MVALTLKMAELTAENGKTAKRTDMASVQDRRAKHATKVRGTTVLNSAECMFGQTAIVLRATGSVDVDTDSGLSTAENGHIKVNGRKVLKHDMEYRSPKAGLVTREVGRLGYRKVMALRSMPMEVGFGLNKQALSVGGERFAGIFGGR